MVPGHAFTLLIDWIGGRRLGTGLGIDGNPSPQKTAAGFVSPVAILLVHHAGSSSAQDSNDVEQPDGDPEGAGLGCNRRSICSGDLVVAVCSRSPSSSGVIFGQNPGK